MTDMTNGGYSLTVTGPNGERQRLAIAGTIDIGREEGDILVSDPAVSRRHLRIELTADGVLATDLGSSHGTFINDQRIDHPVLLAADTPVRIGDSVITVSLSGAPAGSAAAADAAPPPATPVGPRPMPGDFDSIENDRIEVRFRRGSAGERSAKSVARAAAKARHDLQDFGSEPWGAVVVIHLVDPFPDPGDPDGSIVTSGSVVDGERGEIWMVVTPESPPEPPHRVMALLFGSALPCADDARTLIEGYGLHVSGADDVNETLKNRQLPPLEEADGEQRLAMALSYVRFLLAREDDATFRQLLAAPAGRFEETTKSRTR